MAPIRPPAPHRAVVSRRGFLAALAALVFAATASAAPPTEDRRTILFFGDSLTAGYGLENPSAESYPAVVQAKIDAAHLPWRVINAGLSGETSAGGLRRVDWVLRQPVDIFVLELGANDGLRGIDPAVTRQNLEAIVERVRAKAPGMKIVLAGMMMPPGMGEPFATRFQEVFPAVADKEHLVLIPFLLQGVGGQPGLNQADGIHPTAAGARIVAENVWKIIRPLL